MKFIVFAKALVRFLFSVFYKIEVKGTENIPMDEHGYILCANHACWFDPLLIGSHYPDIISFMAKKELFESPILRYFVEKLQAFPVDRKGNDLKAIKTAVKILREGNVLGIFPEGTRNISGIPDSKPGLAIIAAKAGKNILPVAIATEKNYRLFSRLHIVIGEMVKLEEFHLEKRVSRETYQHISDIIMHEIYRLKNAEFSKTAN